MRRATVTLPDDLEQKLERFRGTQPARPSLTAIVQAALERYIEAGMPDAGAQTLLNRVLRHRGAIKEVVRSHGGSNPRLFGSAARGEANHLSDADILIDLEPGRTLFDLAAMRAELEDLLDVPIDIVTSSGLEGDTRDEILTDALSL
ncbi:MAG: nucleotidyltransferase family protein [Acidimicrobiia bacterium]